MNEIKWIFAGSGEFLACLLIKEFNKMLIKFT